MPFLSHIAVRWGYPVTLSIFSAALFAVVAGKILLVQWRHHRKKGRVFSWIVLHLLSVPLALAAYYASQIPAFGVEGMGALGIAMIGMVTIGPLVYFCGHIAVGKLIAGGPGFSAAESMAVALASLVIAGGGAVLYGTAGKAFHDGRIAARRAGIEQATTADGVYAQAAVRRFFLPDKEEMAYVRFRKTAPARLERVDLVYGGRTLANAFYRAFTVGCICGGEIRLAYLLQDEAAPPIVRYYWRRENGHAIYVSELAPDISGAKREAFVVENAAGHIRLPVSVSTLNISIGKRGARETIWRELPRDPGCSSGNCTPLSIPLQRGERTVRIRLYRPELTLSAQQPYDFPVPFAE